METDATPKGSAGGSRRTSAQGGKRIVSERVAGFVPESTCSNCSGRGPEPLSYNWIGTRFTPDGMARSGRGNHQRPPPRRCFMEGFVLILALAALPAAGNF